MVTVSAQQAPLRHPRGRSYRADVQGLRAIAVILVVADHTHLGLPGGFSGVDVFFVISGFVITSLLLRELRASGRVRFVHFYLRRALRLLPALAVMSGATSLLGIVALSPIGTQQQTGVTGFAASFWTSNVALYQISSSYFSQSVEANPFLHTWSLGVEEQFYLVFPLLLLMGWRLGTPHGDPTRANRGLPGAIISISLLSFALSLATSYSLVQLVPRSESFAFYISATRAWEFGVGCLIATTMLGRPRRLPPLASTMLSLVGIGSIATGAVLIDSQQVFPGLWALAPVLGTAAVLLGGFTQNPVNQKALGNRVLEHLGDVSYSWYLWHWPALVFARRLWPDNWLAVAVAVAFSLLLAEASYRFVETRFRGRDFKRRRDPFKIIIPAVGVPAALCLVMVVGATVSWGIPSLRASAEQLNARPIGYRTCLQDTPLSERDMTSCTWGSGRPGKPIYLLGDSNAQMYSEALIDTGSQLGRPVVIGTMGGCPMVQVEYKSPSVTRSHLTACRDWVADAEKWLGSVEKGTVVLAAASESPVDDRESIRVAGGQWATEPDEKASVWEQGLASAVQSVLDAGNQVVLVRTIPHFPDEVTDWWTPSSCGNLAWLRGLPQDCSPTRSLAAEDRRQFGVLEAEEAVAQSLSVELADIRSAVCPGGTCRAYLDGLWLYRDGLHISPKGSHWLAPTFMNALK